ncbi:MAG TPA: EAL domain-containing protein [Pseudolabrys sp.]|nr:EAL domain-containing protein [Pseudolabrys sp.]
MLTPDFCETESLRAGDTDPKRGPSAECLTSIANLPGVVVYQRVVTSDNRIYYTYISEGCVELFGASAEQILSDPEALLDRHSAEYKAKFRERLIGASKTLTTWDVEASIETKDGQKKYTHAIAKPERQADGSVLWTGVILDETRTREAVLEGLSQGFALYDAEDRLMLRNGYFLELYPTLTDIAVSGAAYADVVRAQVDSALNMGRYEAGEELAARLERHSQPQSMFECQLADGRWILAKENRTRDGGTVAVYTDITDLKLRDALGSLCSLPGVVVYQRMVTPDEHIRYTYISESCREIFGVSAKEILSNPDALTDRHSPEYKAKFRERLLAASRSLTIWDVEASIVNKNGQKKYTHAIAKPEKLRDGSVLWTGIILDETRTREAVVEGLSQGLALYDSDDRLVLRNSYFLSLFPGLKDIAVPGANYNEIIRAEHEHAPSGLDSTAEEEIRERLERHGQAHSMTERQIDEERWVLVNENRTTDGGTVILYTDISELKRREREIQFLAEHDALTGLQNRASFQARTEIAVKVAKSKDELAAVILLDLDYFKNVNDTLGHLAGDELLKTISKRLLDCVGPADTVARFGGDEFGILIAEPASPAAVAALASSILDAIKMPVDYHGQQIISGGSIGIALSNTDGETVNDLMKNADLALYRAKAEGRDTFCFFEKQMDAAAQERRALEIDLRQATDRDQLEVHYQPQIDVFTEQLVGFEALVRWRHPKRGLIPPSDFIPLAEETGVIERIGEWVLRRACQDALSWPDSVTVAVNLSLNQFKNKNIVDFVASVLEETQLRPDRLELEITESVLLNDKEDHLSILTDLKALGIRISMDDFGTGYSCLGTLRSFPFDKIKVDRSFVGDLETNPDAAAIIHAVLGLGHSLGMATCAEGVETQEQLSFLRNEGCSEIQGYLYSRPRPIAEIARMLQTGKLKAGDQTPPAAVAPTLQPQIAASNLQDAEQLTS